VATATLTGALLVGDSVHGSLRDRALRRLGPVEHALVARRFFRESLAHEITANPEFQSNFSDACPVLFMPGSADHADSHARVNRINVLGVDARFWALDRATPSGGDAPPTGRAVVLNEPLAEELGARFGDDVLIRLEKRNLVPIEALLGRPDDTTLTLRLTVSEIIPAAGRGGFGIKPGPTLPRNAFVSLPTLQRIVKQRGRVNTILVMGKDGTTDRIDSAKKNTMLQGMMQAAADLDDFDLRLRRDPALGYVSLESARLLIEPPVEGAAVDAAKIVSAPATGILTYFATAIAVVPDSQPPPPGPRSQVPYSTVTAINPGSIPSPGRFVLTGGRPAPSLGHRDILLNDWAATDLGAKPGERIKLTYYVRGPFGRLDTVETAFTLRGIVAMDGWAGDPALTPQYEGITDAENLSDWDPPFPIDMNRIREKDERYWAEHKATPKAFVSLDAGHELWTMSDARFGRLTSIRLCSAPEMSLDETTAAFEMHLRERLAPSQLGLSFEPVRQQALESGAGGTDFGQLFIGFSFFLILSAAMMVALMFRLGVERRATEIGTLLATGFSPKQVARMLLAEGALLAGVGTVIGLVGAGGYAWLMLAGLRSGSWWGQAVNAPFLQLHTAPTSFAIGFAASFVIALLSIAWAIRGLSRMPPRALLAGAVQSGRGTASTHRRRVVGGITIGLALVAAALLGASFVTERVSQTGAFFGGGTSLLAASLGGLWVWLSRDRHTVIRRPGIVAMARLGMRNASRNRGRSLLTVGLIACAAFVIVAVAANRKNPVADAKTTTSPTGGFTLMAEAVIPLKHDLNMPQGREALNLADSTVDLLQDGTIIAFRLKTGDDTSCLNPYKIRQPRILGATDAMIHRGGFVFDDSLAQTSEEEANPWTLLHRVFDDGAVPVIGDQGTVKWLLHLGLGKDLVMTDDRGRAIHLRIVGMLAGSVLQGQLIVAESRFIEMFPLVSGYGFFLIAPPPMKTRQLQRALEHDLNRYGFDAVSTTDRLAEYMAVENTYLSTFQTLGGLGLLLGTLGLAAVMLRGVLERRSELALLRSLGYLHAALAWMVLTESAALLLLGLFTGSFSALLAVAPHAVSSPSDIPWLSLGGTFLAVFLVGMAAGVAALTATLRAPLLPALRME